MKVLLISHAYPDSRYISTLEAWGSCNDMELTLVCPKKYRGESCDLTDGESFAKIAIPVRFGSRQGAFYYYPGLLTEAIERTHPDVIVHEQEVYAINAAQIALAAGKCSIPLVMFVWENVHRSLLYPRRLLTRYVLRSVTGLIAGSCGAEKVHRDWGFKGPIRVIPQIGVEISSNPSYGWRGQGTLRVCFIGRLIPVKGIDTLLRAIATLDREGISVSCSIAGGGKSASQLKQLSQQLKMEKIVQFKGLLGGEEVKKLIQESDVLVLPSRRSKTWEEQFGRVLSEAMAEATVTVGARTGAIGEVIGSDSLLFEEDNDVELTGLLRRLAKDSNYFVEQQKRLWLRAQRNYSNHQLAQEKVQFLREILNGPKPSDGTFDTSSG